MPLSSDLYLQNHCTVYVLLPEIMQVVLGFISRSISNRTTDVIVKMFLVLIRSHLDYVVLMVQKGLNSLESVQKRMVKVSQGL